MRFDKKTLLAFLVLPLMLASCSSESEPADDSVSAKEALEHLKNMITDEKGEIRLIELGNTGDRYMTDCGSEAEAHDICRSIIGDKAMVIADGDYKYPDSYGLVRITKNPEDGIYLSMSFSVKTLPSMQINITTREFLEQNNYKNPPVYMCFECGYTTYDETRVLRAHCMGSFWVTVK